jgi:hypothetical protein
MRTQRIVGLLVVGLLVVVGQACRFDPGLFMAGEQI